MTTHNEPPWPYWHVPMRGINYYVGTPLPCVACSQPSQPLVWVVFNTITRVIEHYCPAHRDHAILTFERSASFTNGAFFNRFVCTSTKPKGAQIYKLSEIVEYHHVKGLTVFNSATRQVSTEKVTDRTKLAGKMSWAKAVIGGASKKLLGGADEK